MWGKGGGDEWKWASDFICEYHGIITVCQTSMPTALREYRWSVLADYPLFAVFIIAVFIELWALVLLLSMEQQVVVVVEVELCLVGDCWVAQSLGMVHLKGKRALSWVDLGNCIWSWGQGGRLQRCQWSQVREAVAASSSGVGALNRGPTANGGP